MNKAILFLPLAVFAIVAAFAVKGLSNNQSALPSAMIDKPVPAFDLPALPDIAHLTHADLKGEVSLVNVFGSWCAACRIEHPTLLDIKESGVVPIYGLNWADTPDRGAAWLMRYGNSYNKVANDESGRTMLDFGVSGAPETFVVDADGRIRYRHVGPVTEDIWKKTLRPLVEELQRQAASDSSSG